MIMSDFGENLFDLMPMHSNLRKKDNQLHKVIDNSVGEWVDRHDVQDFYDNLFLNTATRGYLDRFGADYGVTRQLGESDDDYRKRIILEKFDKLTPEYLKTLYGVELYTLVDGFNPRDNTLVSDNPYYNKNLFMGVANDNVKPILEKKFILNKAILFYEGGKLDYIYDTNDNGMLKDYLYLYNLKNIYDIFPATVKNVKLTFHYTLSLNRIFKNCTGLEKAIINSDSLQSIPDLFVGCTNLKEVTLNTPNVRVFSTMDALFGGCSKLEKINITVRDGLKDMIKTYILGLELQYLTSLIINGEEIDLT